MLPSLWKRAVTSRFVFVVNIVDWFVGASGLDGEILGLILHPAIGITVLSVSSLLIFEHIRDKARSGYLYGDPLCTLGLEMVVTPSLSPPESTPSDLPKQSSERMPPVVTHRGGEDFSLEVRASFTAYYYGYGWLSGPKVTRDKKFNLYWEQGTNSNISRGSIATIRIADWIDFGGYSKKLRVWGDRESVHSDGRVGGEWFTLRVELHANVTDESWEHHYRFRLKDGRFETGENHKVSASSLGRKLQS